MNNESSQKVSAMLIVGRQVELDSLQFGEEELDSPILFFHHELTDEQRVAWHQAYGGNDE